MMMKPPQACMRDGNEDRRWPVPVKLRRTGAVRPPSADRVLRLPADAQHADQRGALLELGFEPVNFGRLASDLGRLAGALLQRGLEPVNVGSLACELDRLADALFELGFEALNFGSLPRAVGRLTAALLELDFETANFGRLAPDVGRLVDTPRP